MGVLGSGSDVLEGRAGVEGNGMGGLGCLESQSLVGLDSLKTGDGKKGFFGPFCLSGLVVGCEGGGKEFGPFEVSFEGGGFGGGGDLLKDSVGALLARALERVELGIEGKKMGDGLLNGALREPVEMLTSEEAFRAAATDEALLLEASSYGDLSLLEGCWGLSSSSTSSFCFGQTLKTSGSFGLGRVEDVDREESMVPMKVMMPMGLLVIRCDSLDWTTGGEGVEVFVIDGSGQK